MYDLYKYVVRTSDSKVNDVIVGWCKNNSTIYYTRKGICMLTVHTLRDNSIHCIIRRKNTNMHGKYTYDEHENISYIEINKSRSHSVHISMYRSQNVRSIHYKIDGIGSVMRYYSNTCMHYHEIQKDGVSYFKGWYPNGILEIESKYINRKMVYKNTYDKNGNIKRMSVKKRS